MPATDSTHALVTADVDGHVYNYEQLIVYSKSHPVIDVKFKSPNSKPSRYCYIQRLHWMLTLNTVSWLFSKFIRCMIISKIKSKNFFFFRLFLKADTLSSNHGKFELKIENIRDNSLDANGEISVQKDNVAFKFFANSDNLGFKNYKMDISSKDANNGKRLEFHATQDGKNMLSGRYEFVNKSVFFLFIGLYEPFANGNSAQNI